MKCPVCNQSCDTVLVCPACWAKVPRYDQIGFRRMYAQHHPKNPKAYASKGEMVIRNLKKQEAEQQTA